MAGTFLEPATISSEKVVEKVELIKHQLKVAMFATGSASPKDLASKLTLRE
jgi:isopentenyl diphosphate isomerase/L-lactate dehydrogenase-like FMN-dependent dehydrogenase